jgi:hypothetical protein
MATATDPCSQHTRASRRGGQIQTASSQLIQASGLPNPRLPEPLSRNPANATPTTGRDSKLISAVSSPYNRERRHSRLGYRSPDQYERDYERSDCVDGTDEEIFIEEQAQAA